MHDPLHTIIDVGLAGKVAFLLRPDAYTRVERVTPSAVETVETHMAWVFLTDRHAWKLKKPVRYEFLDFSTVEARHRDCLEELTLNARLAPGVYLGIVPVTLDPAGRLELGGAGPVVDWLVQMRRLPASQFLHTRFRHDRISDTELAGLADVLAAFYRQARPIGLSGEAYRARLAAKIIDDVEELVRHDHHADGAEELGAQLIAFIEDGAGALAKRAAHVLEGHGDLRPEHICLESPPVVIDCLEFNQDFRVLDPADELSFLAMECEMAGAAPLGRAIRGAVCDRLGERPPGDVFRFYESVRAVLRAKLAFSHVWDVGRDSHAEWRAKGRAYLDLARRRAPVPAAA
jgi:aminoglycoside phosphotransferase family enzyme